MELIISRILVKLEMTPICFMGQLLSEEARVHKNCTS